MRFLLLVGTFLELAHLGLGHTVIPPLLSIPEDNRAFGFTRSAFPPPASRLQQRYVRQQQQQPKNNDNNNKHHNYAINNNSKHQPRTSANPTTVIDYGLQEDLSLVAVGFLHGGKRSADPVLTTTVSSGTGSSNKYDPGHDGQEHRVHHRQHQVIKTDNIASSTIVETAAATFANQTNCDECDCSTAEEWGFELSRLLKMASI